MVVLAGGAAVDAGAARRARWWRSRSRCCGRGSCCRCRSRASRRCSVGLAVLGGAALEPGPVLGAFAALAALAVARRAARPGLAGDRHPLDGLAQRGHERARRARPRRRWRWRATGRSGASARASFAERYREREGVLSARMAAEFAHDPAHDRGRAGGDRPAAYAPAVARVAARVRRPAGARCARRPPGVVAVAAAAVAAAFCALRAAHVRLRGVPRGPADLDAAGDGRGAAPRGAPAAAASARGRAPSPSERLLPWTGAFPQGA